VAYATVAELDAYLGHITDQAERRLDRASRLVDRELIAAIYDRADPDVVEALKAATLEQMADWDTSGADGTEAGDPGQWSTVSAGSIALGRGSRSGGSGGASASTTDRLCTQAALILQQAGLTGQGPIVGRY
jgi:hypothetical protein